jgi:hypothetical protein
MGRRFQLLALLVVFLGGVVLVDRLVVTDEERLEDLLTDLALVVSEEEDTGLKLLLAEDFSFAGPPPVREGDYNETLDRFDDFWEQADSIVLSWREPSMRLSGHLATLKVSGLIRFRSSDVLVVYRVDCEVVAVWLEDAWRLRRIDVLELRRGIF